MRGDDDGSGGRPDVRAGRAGRAIVVGQPRAGGDQAGARSSEDVGGSTDVDLVTVGTEGEHAIRDRPRDVDPVLHDDDGHGPGPAERRQAGGERARGRRVEVGRRLVEHQDPGPRRQRAGEREPLLLAAGQLRRPRPLQPSKADLVERLGHAGQHRLAGPAAALEPERDVVLDAFHHQLALGVLEHEPDPRRHLRTRRRRRVEPIDRQPPLEVARELARHQSRDGQRERALARPRRPDDQQALAGLDLERDVGERLDRAAGEPEAQPVGADRARPAGARLRRQLGTPPGRRPAGAPGPARPTRRPRSRRPRSPSSGRGRSCTSSETSV